MIWSKHGFVKFITSTSSLTGFSINPQLIARVFPVGVTVLADHFEGFIQHNVSLCVLDPNLVWQQNIEVQRLSCDLQPKGQGQQNRNVTWNRPAFINVFKFVKCQLNTLRSNLLRSLMCSILIDRLEIFYLCAVCKIHVIQLLNFHVCANTWANLNHFYHFKIHSTTNTSGRLETPIWRTTQVD